jgi:hypothetical protein
MADVPYLRRRRGRSFLRICGDRADRSRKINKDWK